MKYQKGFSYFNLIVVILLISAFAVFFFVDKENQNLNNEKNINSESSLKSDLDDQKSNQENLESRVGEEGLVSGYETYEPSALAFANKGNVVLFFRASWCPTCRALDRDIENNRNNIPKDLLILDVDYDEYKDLKKKYGVTYQHTLVQVDANGNLIKKWSGSPTLADLIEQI